MLIAKPSSKKIGAFLFSINFALPAAQSSIPHNLKFSKAESYPDADFLSSTKLPCTWRWTRELATRGADLQVKLYHHSSRRCL